LHYLHAADEGTGCLLLAAAVDDDGELVFLAALGLASRPARYLPRFRFNIKKSRQRWLYAHVSFYTFRHS